MSFDNVWQWSETAASNTAIASIDITGTTGKVKDGDNAIRTVMSQIATMLGKGSDTASAATVALSTEGYFHITGTTTITDIDFTDAVDGRMVWIVFDGALTLTHNATTLKLPGGANITTAADDRALFVQDSTDNIICLTYIKASGVPVILASTTEVLTGTDAAKPVTSDALAALWEKGSDEASAATVAFGEGGFFHITGTTTITDIDWDTAKNGRMAWVVFDGALTLTHNGTTLLLPGGANITTAANDRALFVQDATDNVYCLAYVRAAAIPPTTGTWTPTLTFGGGSTGMTGTFSGRYIKNGTLVYAAGSIVLTAKGSSTGVASIGSLPFACSSNPTGAGSTKYKANLTTTGTLVYDIQTGGTTANLGYDTTTGITAMGETNFNNNSEIYFSLVYEATS